MKSLFSFLILGAAMSIAVPSYADQVSFSGAATFTASGSLTFSKPTLQLGTSTGVFAPYAGSFADFTNFNFMDYASGSSETIFTDTAGSNVLTYVLSTSGYSYTLTPDTELGATPGEELLSITGTGTLAFNGADATVGTFSLNLTGVPGGTATFAETTDSEGPVPPPPPPPPPVATTPEPSSLLLLATGLLGVAGATRRRFLRV